MDSGPRDHYGGKYRITVTREPFILTHTCRQASCYATEASVADSFPERYLPIQVIDRPTGLILKDCTACKWGRLVRSVEALSLQEAGWRQAECRPRICRGRAGRDVVRCRTVLEVTTPELTTALDVGAGGRGQ